MAVLFDIYRQCNGTQAMIFVNKKATALKIQSKLADQMKKNAKGLATEHQIKILISGIDGAERDRIIDEFRKSKFNILISTNVLARGIDVPEVDIVINYDVPEIIEQGWRSPDFANYIHRVGRTGRFGTDGVALTLVTDEVEEDMMKKIEKYYQTEIKQINDFS